MFTLSVHEVRHGDKMIAIGVHRGVLEHLIGVSIRSDTHILLAEMLDVGIDVGASKLLMKRNLLEWHAMDAGRGGTKQRSCGEERSLHDCDLEDD